MTRVARRVSAFRSWRLRRRCLAALETARRAHRREGCRQPVSFGGVVFDMSVECAELSGTDGRVVSVSNTTPDVVLVVVEFDEAHVVLISPNGVARHTAASAVNLPFTVRDDEVRRNVQGVAMELALSGAPVAVTAQYRFAPNELVAATLVSPMVRLVMAVPQMPAGHSSGPAS